MARRTGRPRAGEETLTRERVVSTALSVVDEEGLEAMSMRRLAKELGVDPMAIYHHLPNKRALLSGMIEKAFSEMRVPEGAENWDWRGRGGGWGPALRGVGGAPPEPL